MIAGKFAFILFHISIIKLFSPGSQSYLEMGQIYAEPTDPFNLNLRRNVIVGIHLQIKLFFESRPFIYKSKAVFMNSKVFGLEPFFQENELFHFHVVLYVAKRYFF